MNKAFVEAPGFTEWIADHLSDDDYRRVQEQLLENPEAGRVMPGCGGLRKLRIADPKRGKGKRGGARLIYLHIPEAARFYMLDIYGKDEKDDLGADERDILQQLAEQFRQEMIDSVRKRRPKGTK